jgi:hypothetical protein
VFAYTDHMILHLMLLTGPTFFCTQSNMNKNAIANKLYDELFGGPAPPAPTPAPNRKQQAINLSKSSLQLIGRGLSATKGGLSQAGRYVALKSESLVQKLERAQLDLEELERRKAAGNSNVTPKKIIDLKVYIKGLKGKLGKPSKNNNNSSLSRSINRRPIPISLSRSGIYEAYRKKRPSKNFMNALIRVGSVSNSRERADLYYELKSYGPKERTFQNAVNRYIEREKSRPKTNNKGRMITGGATVTGNGRGGQQIIFGGGAPAAAPYPLQAPAAAAPYPIQIPGQVAPYPIQMGGGGAPQISVKVNARGPNSGVPRGLNSGVPRGPNSVVTPPPSASQINMVQNAGGQVAIQKAATALKRANGNVNTAMRETGLPRHTFTNVKNLGGVNIAPRIAASVTRHKKRHTTKKKSSRRKVPKPSIRTNRIKKVVHKVPRKNLERFVLLWALRRKR